METSKIDFVTYGHTPKWLNGKHPKLHIVKHELNMPFPSCFRKNHCLKNKKTFSVPLYVTDYKAL